MTDEITADHDEHAHADTQDTHADDDHGHAEARLGPIDWGAWAYAVIGGAAGAIVLGVFWLALN